MQPECNLEEDAVFYIVCSIYFQYIFSFLHCFFSTNRSDLFRRCYNTGRDSNAIALKEYSTKFFDAAIMIFKIDKLILAGWDSNAIPSLGGMLQYMFWCSDCDFQHRQTHEVVWYISKLCGISYSVLSDGALDIPKPARPPPSCMYLNVLILFSCFVLGP